jgi:hypothetical protein
MNRSLRGALAAALFVLLFFSPTSSVAVVHAVLLPAGTLLQCTLSEPNFSTATVEVGDPVLCQLYGVSEFGQSLPRGSYLGGHLEAAKNPGHFVGKGYLTLQFDRIGLPGGDMPIQTKIISVNGYHVDREGKINGKGHAKRDVAEWMFPPMWPWKVIMLPARGPRPKLKRESRLTLRLMGDVDIPEVAQTYSTYGSEWHSFHQPQRQSYPEQPAGGAPYGTTASPVKETNLTDKVAQPDEGKMGVLISTSDSMFDVTSPPTMPVFVLKNGNVLFVSGYAYQNRRVTFSLAGGGIRVMSADDIDWASTMRVNAQRGVRVTLHADNSVPPGM